MGDEVLVGVAKDVGFGVFEFEVDGIEVGEHPGDEFIFGRFGTTEFGGSESRSSKSLSKSSSLSVLMVLCSMFLRMLAKSPRIKLLVTPP